MKLVRCISSVLSVAIAATGAGCSHKESTRVMDPGRASAPEILEAHLVTDRAALQSAVGLATTSPVVTRALREAPNPRLNRFYQYALRAEGKMSDGSRVGVTVLPHIVDFDSTHAVFVTLLERDGRQIADVSELIIGREPTSLEPGFHPIPIGDRVGWIRGDESYLAGIDGTVKLSPQKRSWQKFVECLLDNAQSGCAAGGGLGGAIAPEVPYSRAIGCAIGVALVAIGCGMSYLR
jgi:hypothetical protein